MFRIESILYLALKDEMAGIIYDDSYMFQSKIDRHQAIYTVI
jgi:hypothetical protein